MLRRIEAGREAFIVVEREGTTLFKNKDAKSCHIRVNRIVVRNSRNGICSCFSFDGGVDLRLPELLNGFRRRHVE